MFKYIAIISSLLFKFCFIFQVLWAYRCTLSQLFRKVYSSALYVKVALASCHRSTEKKLFNTKRQFWRTSVISREPPPPLPAHTHIDPRSHHLSPIHRAKLGNGHVISATDILMQQQPIMQCSMLLAISNAASIAASPAGLSTTEILGR